MRPETRFYLLVTLITLVLWGGSFELVGFYAGRLSGTDLTTSWDRLIPLWTPWIWVYLLGYMLPLSSAWLFRDRHDFHIAFVAIWLATGFCFICYLLFPVNFPAPLPPETFSGEVLQLQLRLDFQEPANKLPSLHVAISWILFFSAGSRRRAGLVKPVLFVLAVLISVSTLLVKQHILWDVAAGLATAWLAVWFSVKTLPILSDPGMAPVTACRRLVRNLAVFFAYIVVFWVLLPWLLWYIAMTLEGVLPLQAYHHPVWTVLGWLWVVGSGWWCGVCIRFLWKSGRGLPISHLPPTRLVRHGVYRVFRHPLYVGFSGLMMGLALVLELYWGFLVCGPLVTLGWIGYARFFEEPRLVVRFGADYRRYREQTPLLWPGNLFSRSDTYPVPSTGNQSETTGCGSDLERINAVSRVVLGQWPTPIESVPTLGGPRVLVKRDDLSGFGRGGAKTRKIECLLGHMRGKGYDELITVAGNVTNLAFDLVPALADLGMDGYLLIQDDPPIAGTRRQVIFEGIADQLHFAGRSRIVTGFRVLGRWFASRVLGKRPFILLPGGGHPSGVVGNALGLLEMAMQRREAGLPFPKVVFVTLATGTTVAGFLVGAHALANAGYPLIEVIGVQVYPGNHRRRTMAALRWTERFLNLERRVPHDRLKTIESELGNGFGAVTGSLTGLVEALERRHGLRIDPIFGGKTWQAMERYLAEHDLGPDEVLYWHCGYTPEWESLVTTG